MDVISTDVRCYFRSAAVKVKALLALPPAGTSVSPRVAAAVLCSAAGWRPMLVEKEPNIVTIRWYEPRHSSQGDRASGTHLTGGWSGLRIRYRALVKRKTARPYRISDHGSPVDQPTVSSLYCLRYPGLHSANIKKKYCTASEQKILGSNPRSSLLRLKPRGNCNLVNLNDPRGTHTILVFGIHGRWGNHVHIMA
jgi:hypothetical protein